MPPGGVVPLLAVVPGGQLRKRRRLRAGHLHRRRTCARAATEWVEQHDRAALPLAGRGALTCRPAGSPRAPRTPRARRPHRTASPTGRCAPRPDLHVGARGRRVDGSACAAASSKDARRRPRAVQLLRAGRGRRACAARRHGQLGVLQLDCPRVRRLAAPRPRPWAVAVWLIALAAALAAAAALVVRWLATHRVLRRRRLPAKETVAPSPSDRDGAQSKAEGDAAVAAVLLEYSSAARRAERHRACARARRPHRLPARQRGEPGGAPRVALALAARPHQGRLHRGGRWLARLAAHAVPPLDAR